MPQRRYASLLANACLRLVNQGRSRLSVTKLDTLIAVALFGEHVDNETWTGLYDRRGDELVLMKQHWSYRSSCRLFPCSSLPPTYSLISISTPCGRSRPISALVTSGVGLVISISLL